MKSDVASLESTLQAQMQAERAQRDSLMTEIRQLRSVLLDSLNVQQRRDITGRVDLQRQILDLNTALNQLLALTGETQRQLARLDRVQPGVGPTKGRCHGAVPGQPGPVRGHVQHRELRQGTAGRPGF